MSVVPTPNSAPAISATRWLDEHGDVLYAYAYRRTRRTDVAEDLVQETLLAGLANRENFDGRSSERTWLTGILRHKLMDHLRRAWRQRPMSEIEEEGAEDMFDRGGHWKAMPPFWDKTPGAQLENAEFRDVLHRCLEQLPPRTAQLFWLREAEEMETEALCQELEISPTNLWTMLHRARSALRQCLSVHWFGKDGR